jgi:predicted MFS family arabinose efflux permease
MRLMADTERFVEGEAAVPAQELSGAYRRTALLLLMLVYTCNFLDRTIIATLGQAIKVDLKITDAELGLLQGIAFAFFYVILGIPLARAAERWNRVSLISACLALWSTMTALCGSATSYLQLFLYRMGVGIGEAGCSPAAHSLLTDMYSSRARATALSIYSLGIPLGTLVGAMSGGWIAQNFSWRAAFVVVGLPGVLLAVVVRLVVREPVRGQSESPTVMRALPAVVPSIMDVARRLFGRASFVHITIGATLTSFVLYGTGTFAQPYFIRAFGLTYAEVGIVFGLLGGLAAAAGIVFGGVASDWAGGRHRRWYALIPALGVLLAAPGYVYAFTRSSWLGAAAALILPTFLNYCYIGPSLGVMHNLVQPRMRATATALFFLVVHLIGLGAGPYVTGSLIDGFSSRAFADGHAGGYLDLCPGGIAAAGSTLDLSSACAAAGITGTRSGIVVVTLLLVWAAVHYCFAARTLARDLNSPN